MQQNLLKFLRMFLVGLWLTLAVNAHGGGVMFHAGVYYWYGEAKSGKTFLPDCNKSCGGTRVDMTGVSYCSFTNLRDWKNEGLVLKALLFCRSPASR